MSELEDLELHLKAAREKFPQIVDDIRPSLQKYCARMTGSVFDGEDVVQDTLAQAYYKLSMLRQGLPLKPWLFRIAHDKCVNFLRSRRGQFEQWQEEGSLDTAQRAHGLWKQKLESYQAPALDPGADEALLDFMARTRAELPDEFE